MDVLVFGTGKAADNLVQKSEDIYNILAFLDNDIQKQGGLFHNKKIHCPDQIKNLDFEAIIIASQWHREIRQQLIKDYDIPDEIIKLPPKSFASEGKRYRPFEDQRTHD